MWWLENNDEIMLQQFQLYKSYQIVAGLHKRIVYGTN